MGGAVGHLMHLYDDPDLQIGEIKKVLVLASRGKLERVTEKVDGRNITFSWNVKENRLKVALVPGDIIKKSGIEIDDVVKKFEARPQAREAYESGIKILEKAISSLRNQDKQKIFGENADIWYSAEIIYPKYPNVVVYDSNTIIFHETPVFYVKEGKITTIEQGAEIEMLKMNIENMQKSIEAHDWSIHGPIIVSMEDISDGTALKEAISAIDAACQIVGARDSDTIHSYTKKFVTKKLSEEGISGSMLVDVSNRIMKEKGALGLTQLKIKYKNSFSVDKIVKAVKSEDEYIKAALRPFDSVISEFAIKVLEGLKSSLIEDGSREIKRIRDATKDAIKTLRSSGDISAINFLESQLKRLGDIETIKTPVEGVVFSYGGKIYKFTGAFAAANQIIGFLKYRRPDLQKNNIQEKNLRKVIHGILQYS
jgi:hypothetical protein